MSEDNELTDYAIRLLFKVPAKSPRDAVRAMVTQLAEKGVVHWAFRVVDLDTQEATFMNGRGETLDVEVFPDDAMRDTMPLGKP